MERPPLGGEGYQRDGASSRFTQFDYSSLNGVFYMFVKAFITIFGNIFLQAFV